MMPRLTLAVATFCAALPAPVAAQDVRSHGPEFQVNSYTTGIQSNAQVELTGLNGFGVFCDGFETGDGEQWSSLVDSMF